MFGSYVLIYDVEQAVKDGATVPICYESRIAKLELKPEELTEGDEKPVKASPPRRWAALERLIGAPRRIQNVSEDIVARRREWHDPEPEKGV